MDSCSQHIEIIVPYVRELLLLINTKTGGRKMDYSKMSDSELARIMVNYIGRVENLQDIIGRYLDGNNTISSLRIQQEYANLKEELRQDAHYIKLKRNYQGSDLYRGAFAPSISEAAACGFCVPVNGKVNFKMYSTVSDVHYKLTKYCSFDEWGTFL